jgi:hypothetical protein
MKILFLCYKISTSSTLCFNINGWKVVIFPKMPFYIFLTLLYQRLCRQFIFLEKIYLIKNFVESSFFEKKKKNLLLTLYSMRRTIIFGGNLTPIGAESRSRQFFEFRHVWRVVVKKWTRLKSRCIAVKREKLMFQANFYCTICGTLS